MVICEINQYINIIRFFLHPNINIIIDSKNPASVRLNKTIFVQLSFHLTN